MPTRTNTKNISSEVELLNIVINPSVDKERSSCWEECFSSQFPTGSMIEKNGMYIVLPNIFLATLYETDFA